MTADTIAPFGACRPDALTRFLLDLSQRTPLGRGKARRVLGQWVRQRHSGPLDTALFGHQARLYLDGNSSEMKALLKPKLYSRAAQHVCQSVISRDQGVVVDVGANAGLFALMAASHMGTGTLVAIEPQPVLFRRLQTNLVDMNPELAMRVRMHLFACAVGPERGELTLNVPDQLGQASLHAIEGAMPLSVSVKPLSDVLNEAKLTHIDVLKIDIEGFEDQALFPFFETKNKALWPRAIVMEHCHRTRWARDCEHLLTGLGYKLTEKNRTDMILQRDKAN